MKQGATLLELTISASIASLVILVLFFLFHGSNQLYKLSVSDSNKMRELSLAMDVIYERLSSGICYLTGDKNKLLEEKGSSGITIERFDNFYTKHSRGSFSFEEGKLVYRVFPKEESKIAHGLEKTSFEKVLSSSIKAVNFRWLPVGVLEVYLENDSFNLKTQIGHVKWTKEKDFLSLK